MKEPNPHRKATQCVHAGNFEDTQTFGTNSPVFTSTTYRYRDTPSNVYPRYFNTPNQESVVQKIAALEGAKTGLLFSSGMSAISTTLLALLQPGDHAIFQEDLYGGTHFFIQQELKRLGVSVTLLRVPTAENFEAAIQENTRLFYLETPSNPLLKLTDIRQVTEVAKARHIVTMIDNTFASPINQNPIALGCDLVMHSGTKYLGGHSDLIFGAILGSKSLIEKIYPVAVNYGGNLNAQTCYLIERSLKTLSVRVKQQTANALHLAAFLQQHPQVAQVYYPGLPDHPGHELAREQMHGFGAMLSFEVTSVAKREQLLDKLQMVVPALSLGGIETLISVPAMGSHSKLTPEERAAVGIKDELLRVSVGIEAIEDLAADFGQALEG